MHTVTARLFACQHAHAVTCAGTPVSCAGFEHSVFNLGFLPLGIHLNNGHDWADFFLNIIPVTIGNILAGVFLVAVPYWWVYWHPSHDFQMPLWWASPAPAAPLPEFIENKIPIEVESPMATSIKMPVDFHSPMAGSIGRSTLHTMVPVKTHSIESAVTLPQSSPPPFEETPAPHKDVVRLTV